MPSETLDRIASSGEAVFAIDRADRIVVWNHACERLLGYPAAHVLGKFCFEIMGGHDIHGNVHCYKNCPVVHQLRAVPDEPLGRFSLRVRSLSGEIRPLSVSAFLIEGSERRFGVIVHVLKEDGEAFSQLEHRLHRMRATSGVMQDPKIAGQPGTLTSREREILLCLAQGLSTEVIASRLGISTVTVRNHVRNVLQKLGVHTRFAAVAFAYQNGIA